jgi:hypothetical protein
VNTALVLENGVCALSLYHELYFLHSSDSGLIGIDHLDLPSLSLNIVCVHAEKLRSKKSRLVTARTGTYLHYDVLVIVRILRKKKNLHSVLKLLYSRLRLIELLLRHLAKLLIALCVKHFKAVCNSLLACLIFLIRVHERCEVALLLHELPETCLVLYY